MNTVAAAPAAGWDVAGGALSLACAVHCLLSSVLLPVAPFLVGEGVELGFAVGILLLGGFAIGRGTRHHGVHGPWMVFAAGALVLGVTRAGLLDHEWEHPAVLIAATAFVVAHLWNVRACRCCGGGGSNPE